MRKPLLVASLLMTVPGSGIASTFTVDAGGGGDYLTIQAAVNAASPGDSVLVQAGIYEETVRILPAQEGILLRGVPGPDFVTVHGDTITLGIWSVQVPVRVEGLTLTGGNLFGALWIQESRAEFRNCVVTGNNGSGTCSGVGGGGKFHFFSDVLVEDCVFELNHTWESPGGLIVWNSHAVIRNSIFRQNQACFGGGLEMYHCEENEPSIIEGNLFVGNSAQTWGGGILNVDSSPVIRNNTFIDNGGIGNASIHIVGGRPEITHNILKGSYAGIICTYESGYPSSRPYIGPNLVWGVTETSDFCPAPDSLRVEEPLFCDPESGDYRLCQDSPGAAEGFGAFGVGCAPCAAVPVTPTTWGRIKSRYRSGP